MIHVTENKPKIYHFGNMIDIELAPLTPEELDNLVKMSFSWQPDISNTRLRMYGSEDTVTSLAADLKNTHPEYHIIIVE